MTALASTLSHAGPVFLQGLFLSFGLIVAIGAQNAFVLRQGLRREYVGSVVVLCAVADAVLIAAGVLGMAQALGQSPNLARALALAGAAFLAVYGWQAFLRFRHPRAGGLTASGAPQALTRRQAVLQALAFSWLNPHAWLDTAVLIGTASLAYGPGSKAFGLGAATGSVVWFLALGVAAFWLGRRLNSLHVWRALDGLVALMMWGTALWLISSLA